ncbi:hypothetical protein OIU76_012438 [Salix suchowensis]|nr:hypothetical protein OIU76_012438 [Salix suchowensis]
MEVRFALMFKLLIGMKTAVF